MYVPKNTKLRTEIIKLHHNSPVAGHPSQWKILKLILHNYWWPRITQKVNYYVSGCDKYQWMKSFPEKPAEKLKPNKSTIASWKDITTDLITGQPEAQGYIMYSSSSAAITQSRHILFQLIQQLWPKV